MGIFFGHECKSEVDGCPMGDVCAGPLCRWDHKTMKYSGCKLGNKCEGLKCSGRNHIDN